MSKKKYLVIIVLALIFIIIGSLLIFNIFYTNNQKAKNIEYAKGLFNEKLVKEIDSNELVYERKNDKLYIINKLNVNGLKIFDELKNKFVETYPGKFNYYVDYEVYYAPDNIMGLIIYEKIEDSKTKNITSNTYYYNINGSMELLNDTYIFKGKYEDKLSELSSNSPYNYILTNDSLKLYTSDNVLDISYEDISSFMNIDYNNKTSNLENINAQNVYADASDFKYVIEINNVYDADSQNSHKIGDIYKGTKVDVLNLGNIFSKIKYDDSEGYVLSKYLTSNFVLKEGYSTVSDTRYINYKSVRIWPDDIKEGEVVAVLSLGDEINRVGESDTWSVFKYNDSYAYVETENTDTTKPKPEDKITKYNINTNVRGNSNIDPSKPMVALTFDDGPSPSSTVRILDTLQKYNVTATFFDVGYLVASYPYVTKREYEIGEVGSHTYNHYNLNNLSYDEIRSEVDKTDSIIEATIGVKPTLLRPPYGNANSAVREAIYDHILINWNVDTVDWKTRDRDAVVNEVRKISNLDGHIILMHSVYSSTADAVEVIVPELLSQGYQLVTVSQLAKYKGYNTLTSGRIYYAF